MIFTEQDIEDALESQFIQRGRGYARAGLVDALHVDENDGLVTALVTGTQPEPYRVYIRIAGRGANRRHIDGECTCPVGYNCKHVAAVLLVALNPSVTAASRGEHLSSGAAASSLDNIYPPGVDRRLLYVLDHALESSPGQVRVNLLAARNLASGGYGRASTYSANNALLGHRARFVLPIDEAILRDLIRARRHCAARDELRGARGAELMERMVGTGRCHWRSKDSPALRPAGPRGAQLSWRVDDHGFQSLALDVITPAVEVLALEPPWFVDTNLPAAGRLELPLPAATLSALLQMPKLAPEDAEDFPQRLAERFPGLALPTPAPVPVETIAAVCPRPALRLHSRPGGIDAAEVSFVYAGERVAAPTPEAVSSRYRAGRVVRVVRDRTAEAARLDELGALGFLPLANFLSPRLLASHAGDLGFSGGDDRWPMFLHEDLPALRGCGWDVELDDSFRFRLASTGSWYAEVDEGGGRAWFALTLGVEVDGERLNILPLLVDMLAKLPRGFGADEISTRVEEKTLFVPLPDGRLLPIPSERVRTILDALIELYDNRPLDGDGRLHLTPLQSGRLAELNEQRLRWHGGQRLLELGEKLRAFGGVESVPPPAELRATLRPYQKQGLDWLQFLREFELGGILADDMGLGKTVQALAHLLVEKAAGRLDRPCLVVAPTSLVSNWQNEARRFAPDLKVLTLHGPRRHADFDQVPGSDLVLTTYPLLHRDREPLAEHHYHLLLLDEAQVIKNPKTQASRAAKQLRTRHRLCLTGTPMENHLGELWSVFDFLMPGILGDEAQFRRLFRTPIERHADDDRATALSRRIAPFVLRRTKTQVAAELPPKTEIIRSVELDGEQRDLYESVRLAMHARVRQEISRSGLARSQIVILDALLKLRQICCDPRLVKLESARRVRRSAKLELLLDLVPEMVEEGRRILLFSQFTGMLALIEEALQAREIDYLLLTGRSRDRGKIIERFQSGEVPVFLISLKAGGVGLNLTAADTVIHYDPWWNPAVEDQASDRAHRIGQDKPVFVYRLLAEGTVEEQIQVLQSRKRALLDGIYRGGGQARTQWSRDDLEQLFKPLACL